jgi:hypothetical protein
LWVLSEEAEETERFRRVLSAAETVVVGAAIRRETLK